MKDIWTKLFINSAGAILLAAALERFLIIAGHAQILSSPDPALGVPLRYSVSVVGGIELAVALICFFGKSSWRTIAWIAWLATDFIVFELSMGCPAQSTCIGNQIDPLHLSRGIMGIVLTAFPFYLLVGSYGTLAWLWMARDPARDPARAFSKMSCPACGTHIKFNLRNLGQIIPCPHCQSVVTLRKPEENVKISCYFCKGRIEFAPHAIGTKMACPHCKMDITLKEPATA